MVVEELRIANRRVEDRGHNTNRGAKKENTTQCKSLRRMD